MRARLGIIVSIASLAVASCESHRFPDSGPPSGCLEAAAPVPTSRVFYAITRIVLDPSDNPDTPHSGFDLDGFFSEEFDPGSCGHADFFSAFDNRQHCNQVTNERCVAPVGVCSGVQEGCARTASGCHGGVDNQWPSVLNSLSTFLSLDLRTPVQSAIDEGRMVTLIEVVGANEASNVRPVRVRLFRAHVVRAIPCATAAEGFVYQIDRSSITELGVGPDDARFDIAGSIEQDQLRATGGDDLSYSLEWPTPPGVTPLALELHHVTLGGQIFPARIVDGNFGAWIPGSVAVQLTGRLAIESGTGVTPDQAVSFLSFLVDIANHGVCAPKGVPTESWGAVSMGFGFEAVRVQIDNDHPIVDAPGTGGCEFTDGGADANADASVDAIDASDTDADDAMDSFSDASDG